ncbi:MAG: NAD-dependent epimerase/dehydratase family protein [Acidiferrobacterales bacterium]
MAIFITGGYGHIASWAAFLLAKQGRQVIVYDKRDNAPDYLNEVSNNIEFIKGDVLDLEALTDAFKTHDGEIEGVIHTVAIMGEQVQLNPHHNMSVNIMGLVNVLEASRSCKIKKIVYTSTGAVYGAVDGLVPESSPPNPPDLYAATKISAEYLGAQYGRAFGIDFRVGRLYFVYGPGKYPSRFIKLYQLAFGALEGIEGLKADKGADQRVDFTYVEDAARGIVLLFDAKNLGNKTFNIAMGQAHTVGEAAELAQRYTHFPVRIDIGPGELMRRSEALDISRAVSELGYQPQYSLEEGVKRYADWLKAQTNSEQ